MIALSTLIERYGGPLLERYGSQLLPEHRRALSAMRHCRTEDSPMMMSQCTARCIPTPVVIVAARTVKTMSLSAG